MLAMTDEAGPDAKLLAVPVTKLCKSYAKMKGPKDAPELLLAQIKHFFEHYKDLEDGKWVKVEGWLEADAAKNEITSAIKRYNDAPEKPCF